ncbi:PaaI family thioesterase [Streptacidiphilus fuscans]|uniref:Acyl-coenzyme A thioesterase THEM4 n=1 Tax=Streptacidiphilus fuscans TaxID=2789292 RepID=A0A931B8L3_9ACTN|nr:PaaI family thioesterase [Streptacidiphilus fuscans]MBF9071497.1 PaaI family thioesterase [Streptacidiphilus fuscans]
MTDSPRPSLTPPPDAAQPVRHPDAPAPGKAIEPHYEHCFACGPAQPHGLHLSSRAGEGVEVFAEFTVGTAHQGAPGLAHGGVLVTAMDDALGTLNWLLHTTSVTARLETDFRAPVPVDSTLYLHTWAEAVVGRKIYCRGEARLGAPDGPLALTARALFIQVTLDHFVNHGRPEDIKAVIENPDLIKRTRAFEVNP